MSSAAEPPDAGTREAAKDPYLLDPSKIKEPPRGSGPSLRFLGPGMITSAAVVGSGELLTATALGAQVGFVLLWLVLVSTFVKVWVQIALARWAISTGRPAVTGYNDVPPKIAKRGWMAYLSLLLFAQFLIGQAGVISAAAFAFSTLFPIGGDPYTTLSIGVWVAILAAGAIAIHLANRYETWSKTSQRCWSSWSPCSRSAWSSWCRAPSSPGASVTSPGACGSRSPPDPSAWRWPCSG